MEYFIPHEHTVGELTVEHMKVCPILCGILDGREVWGRIGTGMSMVEPLSYLYLVITMLFSLTQTSSPEACATFQDINPNVPNYYSLLEPFPPHFLFPFAC